MQTTWDLSKYFYSGLDDTRFLSDVTAILPKVESFAEKYHGKIKNFQTAAEVLDFYRDEEKLSFEIGMPSLYLFYLSSLDTQNTDVLKKQGEVESIFVEVGSKLLFIEQEWKELGYDKIMKFAEDPLLKAYKNALVTKAENLKYLLWEREEYVLNEKSRALSTAWNLRRELANSYEFEIEIDGQKKTLTLEELWSLRRSPDREIRKKATESMRKVFSNKQAQISFGQIYSGIVKNWVSDVKIRGFSSVMEPRNVTEQLENETIDMLLQEVQNAYPLFARFLEAKRKILGYDTFYNYDIIAPISKIEKTFEFNEAATLHLETMKEFDQEFYDYSRDMLENGRIDVFPKYGKRSGAYASYRQGEESFVLLNYTKTINDISTLSHELGHAIHGHLSQAQKPSVYESPLSLAETASIFSEMLLAEKIKKDLSEAEKAEFLNEQLGNYFATIFRQIQYIVFEKRVHEAILSGQELTYKDYNRMWREEQVRMCGTAIAHDVPDTEESGWSMIPHIFSTPFYCYAYSFGTVLVFALYSRYKEEGKPFVESYKDILRAGGSERPKDLLARHGFDITSREFYQSALREVERMVEEFEWLTK